MAHTYRDLKVSAVAENEVSQAFYVKQRMDHPVPEGKFLLRLDNNGTSANGDDLVNTSNGELKVFGNQNKVWLDGVLKGYRKELNGAVYITVTVVPTMPEQKELEAVKFF